MKHHHLSALILLALPTPALATFGCEIVANDAGYVPLLAAADDTATVLLKLPAHAIVSLFTVEPNVPEGWAYVAYSTEPNSVWGAGLKGWLRNEQIDECG